MKKCFPTLQSDKTPLIYQPEHLKKLVVIPPPGLTQTDSPLHLPARPCPHLVWASVAALATSLPSMRFTLPSAPSSPDLRWGWLHRWSLGASARTLDSSPGQPQRYGSSSRRELEEDYKSTIISQLATFCDFKKLEINPISIKLFVSFSLISSECLYRVTKQWN